MEMYSLLRGIADSWVLLAMFGFFVAVVIWAFRPGSSATYKAVGEIPLRDDKTLPIHAAVGSGGGDNRRPGAGKTVKGADNG
ncbi:MAG: cbb3-type cytochrome c oxidase subunit 3 [Rhodobacter sp.]|nr:cbb3-type cytochrome c oxidase subunit 3 [Rhodobacter sp.]